MKKMKEAAAVLAVLAVLGAALHYRATHPEWTQEQCKKDDAFLRDSTGECRKAGYD